MKPEDLIKTAPSKRLHLNVRLTSEETTIWDEYRRLTPNLTDSQRVRDAIRLALYAVMTKSSAIDKLAVLRPGDEGNTGRRQYSKRKGK